MAELKCLNPYDCQSKRIYDIDGVYRTLDAGNAVGGQAHGICYAIDQQGGKSNAGYAEDVMMTILSDSHGTPHGVCYALEGNGSRPSHGGVGYSESGQMYTLNTIEQHGVCYSIEGNVVDRNAGQNGKGWQVGQSYTLNSTDRHAVCYIQESISQTACDAADVNVVVFKEREGNGVGGKGIMVSSDTAFTIPTFAEIKVCYGVDCRNATLDRERTHTIQASCIGVSVNCVPSVLMEKEHEDR